MIRASNKRLVDARSMMRALCVIASGGQIAMPEITEATGLSLAGAKRLLTAARTQFGVEIVWRRDNTLVHHGEYTVEDWGVFDQTRVRKLLKRRK
ncbi:MAG: hypothetical protein ABIT70_08330 [Sulfuriferula sp.]